MLTETSEAVSILDRLDGRESWPVLSHENRLHESFALLVKVPLLQVVNRREVVDRPPRNEAVLA